MGAQRTENIVRFKALLFNKGIAERGKQLFEYRQLACKLRGHTLAPGLVCVEHLMAEGGRLEVKSDCNAVRFALLFKLQQNIHKAVNGVGELAVLG